MSIRVYIYNFYGMKNLPNDKDLIKGLLDEYLDLSEEYDAAIRVRAPLPVLEELRSRMEKIQKKLQELKRE